MVHLNTRSVLNKLDELKLKLKNFDVVVFTETWLSSLVDDSLLSWQGFKLARHDRGHNRNKKGGGVCIYIRDTIPFISVDEHNGLNDQHLEFVLVKLKPHMQKPINLFGIYRPPDGTQKECVARLTLMVNQMDRAPTDTLLISDFNLNYKNKKLFASSKLETLVTKFSLKQLIKENTRVTSTSASCFDLLFTDIHNISDSGVINYNISDHSYLLDKEADK